MEYWIEKQILIPYASNIFEKIHSAQPIIPTFHYSCFPRRRFAAASTIRHLAPGYNFVIPE